MIGHQDRDEYLAGRLIQWGLRPKAIPFNEPESQLSGYKSKSIN